MKKLLIILSIIISCINGWGQTRSSTPGTAPRANQFFVPEDGNLSVRNSLIVPRFTDTTQANTYTLLDTSGRIIYTYDVQSFWGRQWVSGSKKWVALGSGGGGTASWGSITGTLSDQTDLQTALNLKAPLASPTFTGTVTFPTPFTLGAVSVLPTGTELNFVDGVTSNIQTQLDGKQATITFGTGVLTALGVNIGSAGAPVLFNGAAGTPSSLTGTNITGTASGLNIGGNAATATIFQTARNIQGVSFNGSAAIDIINGTGFVKATGTTLSYDNSTYVTSNIYTADGTLAGDRIVNLNGNTLEVQQGGNTLLFIDPTTFLSALRADDGTGNSTLTLRGNVVGGDVLFGLSADDNVNTVTIEGNAVANTLEYIAGAHTFTGSVNLGTAGSSTGVFTQSGVTSGTITFQPSAAAGTYTLTWPTTDGGAGEFLQTNGSGVLTWASGGGGLTIGTTTITSGTNTRVLFNNSGVVGEYSISGTGNVAMTTSPTFNTSILLAGSTSGNVTIASDALGNTIQGAVLSGTGTIPVEYDIYVRSDETLANSTADQPLLTNTAHDLINILANTTYDFIIEFDLTHGAVSHNFEFGMIPTTATITSIAYNAIAWVTAVGTNTATQNSVRTKVTTTTQVVAAGANATETCTVTGWFTVGATGGSIMPTIQFSADPTGTVLLKAGARFKLIPRGNDTFTQIGPIQ